MSFFPARSPHLQLVLDRKAFLKENTLQARKVPNRRWNDRTQSAQLKPNGDSRMQGERHDPSKLGLANSKDIQQRERGSLDSVAK